MEVGLRRYASKYLSSVILTACTIISSLANANQTAQGTIQLSITALSQSASITSATCEIDVKTTDATTQVDFEQTVIVQAQVANNSVKCTMTAPYQWSLTDLTAPIFIFYTISGMNGSVLTNSTTGGFDPIPGSTTGTIPLSLSTVF